MRQLKLIFSGLWILLFCCCFTPASGWNCNNGEKINDNWLCDDQLDCTDGSDETSETCSEIKQPCAENQFRCNNSRCIDISFRCDGEPDCLEDDISDELGCNTTSEPSNCGDGFLCGDGTCLPIAWVCDGYRDCTDTSDELHCPCNNGTYGCFVRTKSFCLPDFTKCDGIPHCDDRLDEIGCTSIKRPEDDSKCLSQRMYSCRTGGECIFWKLVCDGYGDCKDSSDEGSLCHVNDCGQGQGKRLPKKAGLKKTCEQFCYETPDGGVCVCGEGYKLGDDGIHCLDINECEEMRYAELHNVEKFKNIYSKYVYGYGIEQVCSQNCRNLAGGFRCTCVEGYQIDTDEVTCKALGDDSPDLYVGIDNEIRVFSLRGSGEKTLYYGEVYKSNMPDESIIDMDVHAATSAIFWIEDKSRRLKTMIGTNVRSFDLDFKPASVCVDWVTGNLYVSRNHKYFPTVYLLAESKGSTAMQQKTEVKSIAAKILSVELVSPVALAVYPQKGILVIADAGRPEKRGPRILVASMDGTNVGDLVSGSILTPTDLVIDYVSSAVIWTSVGDPGPIAKVESIRLDGTQRGVIMSSGKNRFPVYPVSIATFEDRLYVSDSTAREVRSWKTNEITLYGDENAMYGSKSVIKQRQSRLESICISHPVLQRPIRGANLCRSFGCSHLCVMVPTVPPQIKDLLQNIYLRASCLCPLNYQLIGDKECKVSTSRGRGMPKTSPSTTTTTTTTAATTTTTTTASTTTTTTTADTTTPTTTTPTTTIPTTTIPTTTIPTTTISTTTIPTTTTAAATTTTTTAAATTTTTTRMSSRCLNPGVIDNSVTTPADTRSRKFFSVGSSIRYTCVKGYVFSDDFTSLTRGTEFDVICTKGGWWSAQIPECVREASTIMAKVPGLKSTTARIETTKKPAIITPNFITRQKQCSELQCGLWGRCVKGGNKKYECSCLYGKSTQSARCLPPRNAVSVGYSTASPTPRTEKSRRLTPSKTALIVVAVLIVILIIILGCRCLRKTRYSVDLHYVRGMTKKYPFTLVSSSDSTLNEPAGKGKPASITNPNYASPSRRKRPQRPAFRDDLSVSDSGIQRSFGSDSPSSAASETSVGEGTSCALPAGASDQPNSPVRDDIFQMEAMGMGELGMRESKSGRLGARIGQLFKMRKTESRECMLPESKSSTKSSSR